MRPRRRRWTDSNGRTHERETVVSGAEDGFLYREIETDNQRVLIPFVDEGLLEKHSAADELKALLDTIRNQTAVCDSKIAAGKSVIYDIGTLKAQIRAFKIHAGSDDICITEAQSECVPIPYQEAENYPELVAIARQYDWTEKIYNKAIKSLKKAYELPDEDIRVPDIGAIDGEALGFPGYYMQAMSKTDVRNFIMGRLMPNTECCGSIDNFLSKGATESSVSSPDVRNYTLFKQVSEHRDPDNDSICARMLAMRGTYQSSVSEEHSGICLNSWEGYKDTKQMAMHFCEALSEAMMKADESIDKVTLGVRYREFPKAWNKPRIEPLADELIKHTTTGIGDYDTQQQIVMLSRHQLRAMEKGLELGH